MNFHGAVPFQKPALKLLLYLPLAFFPRRFAAHFSSCCLPPDIIIFFSTTSTIQIGTKNAKTIANWRAKKSWPNLSSKKFFTDFCIIIFCSVRILCGLFWRCWQQQLLHSAVLILLHNHHGFTSHHLNLPRAQARWMIRRYFSLIVYFITVILFTFFPLSLQSYNNTKDSFSWTWKLLLTFLMLLLKLWLAVRQENNFHSDFSYHDSSSTVFENH